MFGLGRLGSSITFRRYLLLSLIMLSAVAVFLYLSSWNRVSKLNQSAADISNYDVSLSSIVIEKQISELNRAIDLFAQSYDEEISNLARFPGNSKTQQDLFKHIKYYFPHALTFTISDEQGLPLYSFEREQFGNDCKHALEYYSQGHQVDLEVHTVNKKHHVDIMTPWQMDDIRGHLQVSFDSGLFASYLDSPHGHELMLINTEDAALIEVASSGPRAQFSREIFLDDYELENILSSRDIQNSKWKLVDVKSLPSVNTMTRQIYLLSWLIFLGFALFMFISVYALFIEDRQLQSLDSEYKAYKGQIEDVIEEKTADLRDANARLEHLSLTDGLTGIANRRQFDYMLSRELRRATRDNKRLNLLLFDIDYYKRYNDALGHLEGDKCLKKIANKIDNEFRRGGDLTARFGGEEFAIILPDISESEAANQAERVRSIVMDLKIPHPDSDVANVVTVSVGVASLLGKQFKTIERLMKEADTALNQAKSYGRNCTVTTST